MAGDPQGNDLINLLWRLTGNYEELSLLLDSLDIDQLTKLSDALLRLSQECEVRLM
jgi:muconolactone delta-isomerase